MCVAISLASGTALAEQLDHDHIALQYWTRHGCSLAAVLGSYRSHQACIGLSGRWGRCWTCLKQLWAEERKAEKAAGFVCSSLELRKVA